jgi:arabinogalactan endo-1,4-beta-galactosidase
VWPIFIPLQNNFSITLNQANTTPDASSLVVPANFILGADISSYPQVIDGGGIYHHINGTPGDLFDIITPVGFKFGRLRLWVDPTNIETATQDYGNFNHTLEMAQLMTTNGWSYLLDYHYSDWWADPSTQTKPQAWENLTFSTLLEQIYNYTYDVLDELREHDALPAMIQTGNEISHGML